MNSKTILVVDDEAPVRQVLRSVLEAEGWLVREASNLNETLAALDEGGIDLVTLDLGLSEDGGLKIARDLRGKANIPVVIISGHGAPFERARGLESGADDYVVKPFDNREVAIRIRRVLERYDAFAPPNRKLRFDHSSVDLARGLVLHNDGRQDELTDLESRLFELFLSRPARVLSRDDISLALHGREWSPLDRTIDGHVARLRRKIEPDRSAPTLIRSVRGVGYVFSADIGPDPSGPEATEPPPPQES